MLSRLSIISACIWRYCALIALLFGLLGNTILFPMSTNAAEFLCDDGGPRDTGSSGYEPNSECAFYVTNYGCDWLSDTPAGPPDEISCDDSVPPPGGPGGPGEPGDAVGPPTISYTTGGRPMIYVNNPERLLNVDLANNRNRPEGRGPSLLTVSIGAGQYRDYFEHLNETGVPVAYGLYAWNPTTETVVVNRTGKGWAAGDFRIGGEPFVQLLNSGESTILTLPPSTGGWIFRSDDSYGSDAGITPQGQFLTGVVDFDVTVQNNAPAQIIVHHLVYDPAQFAALPGSYDYIGYETRLRPGDPPSPESRTYKGISSVSEVTANINLTIESTNGPQDIQVTYPQYVADPGGTYVPGPALTSPRWYTHEIPARDKSPETTPGGASYVVANDMVSFDMPGWGVVDPFTRSSAPLPGETQNSYPNLGNWGVVYNHNLVITNNSGRNRTVDVKLGIYNTEESDNALFAYQINNSVWQTGAIVEGPNPEEPGPPVVTLGTINAVPGTATYPVRMVLGAPADGRLFHALTLAN